LTPAHDVSESEGDEDEESTLSNINANDLQFSHRGQTLTLRTAVEIKAWIAERKKRWPTAAKREKAKLEAEERKKKWEDEKAKKREMREEEREKDRERRAGVRRRLADEERVRWVEGKAKERQRFEGGREKKASLRIGKDRREKRVEMSAQDEKAKISAAANEGGKLQVQAQAQSRADKLRHKARQAQLDLEAAERELRELDSNATPSVAITTDATLNYASDSDVSMSSVLSNSSVLTSSSSESASDASSDTDSHTSSPSNSDIDEDNAPEAQSTKHPVPSFPQPQQTPPSSDPTSTSNSKAVPKSKQKGPCQYFSLHGRCKYGSKCKFSHTQPSAQAQHGKESSRAKAGTKTDSSLKTGITGKRKGLYQVMVDKEREDARKRVLDAIIGLGKRGVLDEK
jgi:hypothetical protein